MSRSKAGLSRSAADLLAGQWAGDNCISDDMGSVKYAEIADAWQRFDVFFSDYREKEGQCICLFASNTIPSILLTSYLMTRGINVYLRSSALPPDAPIPGFCDKIIRFAEGSDLLPALSAFPEMKDNPGNRRRDGVEFSAGGMVLFSSSGTSGRPKFVGYTAANLIRNAGNCVERFRIGNRHTVLVPVPVAHMYGFGAGWLPALLCGANIVLIEKTHIIKLIERLHRFKPDLTLLTPALCRMMLTLDKKIPSEGMYVTAGERIGARDYSRFEIVFGKLINLYGCTEMGAIATSDPEATPEQRATGTVYAMSGVDLKIDGAVRGELLCRHPAGFAYYLDADGQRAPEEAVDPVYDSGHDQAQDTMYRTKDIGIKEGDRGLRVAGRMDHCINRLGFLFSPQEIETRIEELLPEVGQAVVLVYDTETAVDTCLVAVCVCRPGKTLSDMEAKKGCKDHLPGHMMPNEFHFVPELPKLAGGKPDRSLLREEYSTIYNH